MGDVDTFGRPVIHNEVRERMRRAFQGLDPSDRGALIILGDTNTRTVRAHLAAKLGDGPHAWQVAAGGGIDWTNRQPFAEFAILKTW